MHATCVRVFILFRTTMSIQATTITKTKTKKNIKKQKNKGKQTTNPPMKIAHIYGKEKKTFNNNKISE